MVAKCLTIAGFDGSGGAGIQADIKTFTVHGCYALSVLTALPIQNTCGVKNCYPFNVDMVKDQLDAIFEDTYPDSIKIGMLFSVEIIECVHEFLLNYAQDIPIVLDPVMVATSGDPLLEKDAVDALKILAKSCTILTPNIPEALALTSGNNLAEQTKALLSICPNVLLKGGHQSGEFATDVLYSKGQVYEYSSKKIQTQNTHGTGCTLSAAIAAFLAKGYALTEACKEAKDYLTGAIASGAKLSIGQGNGPVDHLYQINGV